MTISLFIDLKVPAPDDPTSPHLVFYENGDWNIEFGWDIDYLSSDKGFLGSASVAHLINRLSVIFSGSDIDIGIDECDLFFDEEFEDDGLEEPVILLMVDGSTSVSDTANAKRLLDADNQKLFNYIPVSEFLYDVKKFVANRQSDMFDDDYDCDVQPLDFDEY